MGFIWASLVCFWLLLEEQFEWMCEHRVPPVGLQCKDRHR